LGLLAARFNYFYLFFTIVIAKNKKPVFGLTLKSYIKKNDKQ